MIKSSWKQLMYLDIFTQPVAVYLDRFVFLFVATLTNGGPYGCIMGLTGNHWNTSCTVIGQSVIILIPSVVKMKQQPGTM